MEEQSSTSSQGGSKIPLVISGIIILIVIVGGLYFFFGMSQNQQPAQVVAPQQEAPTTAIPSPTIAESMMATPSGEAMKMGSGSSAMKNTQVFSVDAQNFSFTPKEMTVKKGNTVKILFTNKQGTHDFIIDEFDVKTKMLQAGQSEMITFVADKAGKFQYYCGIGNHRAMGMWGTLTVQ